MTGLSPGPRSTSSYPVTPVDLERKPSLGSQPTVAVRPRVRSGYQGIALCRDERLPCDVKGAFSVKGPDSSLGGVPEGYCSEDIHMEEEKVEVKVQEEEVDDRERR